MYLKLQFLLHKKKNTVSPLQDESANTVYENNRCLFWESYERAEKSNVCREYGVFLCWSRCCRHVSRQLWFNVLTDFSEHSLLAVVLLAKLLPGHLLPSHSNPDRGFGWVTFPVRNCIRCPAEIFLWLFSVSPRTAPATVLTPRFFPHNFHTHILFLVYFLCSEKKVLMRSPCCLHICSSPEWTRCFLCDRCRTRYPICSERNIEGD